MKRSVSNRATPARRKTVGIFCFRDTPRDTLLVTNIALVGIGNSALALLRALQLAHAGRLIPVPSDAFPASIICGLAVTDIEVVCGYDVDVRKIGKSLDQAAVSPPNFLGWQ